MVNIAAFMPKLDSRIAGFPPPTRALLTTI
jgi:hypothetical protein